MKYTHLILLAIIFSIVILSGCTQQPKTEEKGTGLIVYETNTTPYVEPVKNESNNVTETPKEEPKCTESKVYSGKCVDNSNIEEEICKNGKIENVVTPCKNNYICSESICRPDPNKCIDTDGGENRTLFGKVIYNNTEYLDKCVMGDIIEYYCSNNGKVLSTRKECPVGTRCLNGSCMPWAPTCSKKSSTVTVDYHNYEYDIKTDHCNGYYKLIRYGCLSNGSYDETEINCASDEWCSTETLKCEKKRCDNGYGNIITKDSTIPDGVYYDNTFNTDYCMYNTTIKEVYCDGKTAKNATVDCPTGYICSEVLVNRTNTDTGISNEFYSAYCEFINN